MRVKNGKFRIEINFDLSMKLLDSFYPGGRTNRHSAYREIKKYLKKQGFTHPLFSGYLSKNFYTDNEVRKFINDFFDNIPWAENCMKGCHVTVVHDEIIDALTMRKLNKEVLMQLGENILEVQENEFYDNQMSFEEQLIYFENLRDLHLMEIKKLDDKIRKCKEQIIK